MSRDGGDGGVAVAEKGGGGTRGEADGASTGENVDGGHGAGHVVEIAAEAPPVAVETNVDPESGSDVGEDDAEACPYDDEDETGKVLCEVIIDEEPDGVAKQGVEGATGFLE